MCSGGSKGGRQGRAPPPLGQNFFIFMQFLRKIGQIVGWRPPLGIGAPPLGNPGSATVVYSMENKLQFISGGIAQSVMRLT